MTTTTINASGSERMFRAAAVVALLIAVAALTLTLINRPSVSVATEGSSTSVAATQAKSLAALVPGGSVYGNQVPLPATSVAAVVPGGTDGQVPAMDREATGSNSQTGQVSQPPRKPGPQP